MKPFGLTAICCLILAACGENSNDHSTIESAATTTDVIATSSTSATPEPPANNHVEQSPVRTKIIGASEIPYPVYPNGSRYRVGDENGLKIVLYQTKDSFDDVDRYYRSKTKDVGMPRLSAMSDYVRYASSTDDEDPWATSRPGIVIHQFNNDSERAAVGADQQALTNIIMSF